MNKIELLFCAQFHPGFPVAGSSQPTHDDTLLDKFRLSELNGQFFHYMNKARVPQTIGNHVRLHFVEGA